MVFCPEITTLKLLMKHNGDVGPAPAGSKGDCQQGVPVGKKFAAPVEE